MLLVVSLGCLRNRWSAEEETFRDHPAIPKQHFGRQGEQIEQMGVDDRSRQIESSLGVEGGTPRLFNR
jgi:hypothetical protein